MTSDSQPHELLSRARRGDGEALGELLEGLRQYLKLLAELQIDEKMQAKVDASDVVQETFLAAHRDFSMFRGTTERELMAWLRKILAANLADRVHRHYGRQRRNVHMERSLHEQLDQSSRALDHGLVAVQTTPSEQVARREQAVMLADALEQLPKDYRTVLVLHHLKGLPFKEVAGRMGRSLDSVKQLWMRALVRLRRIVGDER